MLARGFANLHEFLATVECSLLSTVNTLEDCALILILMLPPPRN